MTNGQKEWIQYGSAMAMLLSGVALTFLCFFTKDDVTANVLYYVGECLLYSGGLLGISAYAKNTIKEEMGKLKDLMNDARKDGTGNDTARG